MYKKKIKNLVVLPKSFYIIKFIYLFNIILFIFNTI